MGPHESAKVQWRNCQSHQSGIAEDGGLRKMAGTQVRNEREISAKSARNYRKISEKSAKNQRKISEKYMPDEPYNVIISICYRR
jgi:hypothetical protein